MNGRAINLSILGLPASADAAAVKRAFIQLVRENTPEADPERFIQISAAYRQLTSPETRHGEREVESIPEEVETALSAAYSEQAKAHAPIPSKHEVLQDLRKLLKTHRESRHLRYHFASLLLEAAGGALEALTIATELVGEPPDDPNHFILLAQCFGAAGQKGDALRAFQQLARRYPDYVPGILAVARFQVENVSTWSAIETLNEGLARFGEDPLACTPLLELRFLVEARDPEPQPAESTAKQMAALASGKLTSSALRAEVHDRLQMMALDCLDKPKLAQLALTLASEIAPVAPELKSLIEDQIKGGESGIGCWNAIWLIGGIAFLFYRCSH